MPGGCCAIRRACSTPRSRSGFPAPAGCTICSSRTRRCRPANGRPAAPGLTVSYGFHPSPFGTALVMATDRGLAGLAFADPGEEKAALADMRGRWPQASYVEDSARTAPLAQRIFDSKQWRPDRPLRVVLIGTDFEVRVWETLLEDSDGPRHHLFGHRGEDREARGLTCRRRGGRQEPGIVRGAVPPRARQERRHHRLSLGPHAQARDAGLGGRAGRRRA